MHLCRLGWEGDSNRWSLERGVRGLISQKDRFLVEALEVVNSPPTNTKQSETEFAFLEVLSGRRQGIGLRPPAPSQTEVT